MPTSIHCNVGLLGLRQVWRPDRTDGDQPLVSGRLSTAVPGTRRAAALFRPELDRLRRFQPLVQRLSRSHWIEHIKGNRRNSHLLGHDSDLGSFLFETSRQALSMVTFGLRKLSNRCHYCGIAVREAEVDHFIPHALYPRDLVHNLVLAHPSCNRSKSDTLAAKHHVIKWLEFIKTRGDDLKEIGYQSGIVADSNVTHSVARWGYANAAAGGAQAWVKSSHYEVIDGSYIALWN